MFSEHNLYSQKFEDRSLFLIVLRLSHVWSVIVFLAGYPDCLIDIQSNLDEQMQMTSIRIY